MQSVEKVEQQRDRDQTDQHRKTKGGFHDRGSRSDLFDHDRVDLVGDIIEAVGNLFQVIVDLGADDEVHRVGVAVFEEQLLQSDVVQIVDPPFEFGQFL